MRALHRLSLVLAAGVIAACGDSPTAVISPGPGPSLPPAWQLVPIDSPSVGISGVGITPDGEVIGTFVPSGTQTGAYRWKDGVFQVVMMPGTAMRVDAINDVGDAVGITGEYIPIQFSTFGHWIASPRPFIWRKGEAAPKPLFVRDTNLTPVAINNHGDVLLRSPLFYPGAAVLRNGEIRAVNSPVAIEPIRIDDAGLIVAVPREGLTTNWLRVVSPFASPGTKAPSSTGRCPWGNATVVFSDRDGNVISGIYRDGKLSYVAIDNGVACRGAAEVAGMVTTGFNSSGWAWGYTTDVADTSGVIRKGDSRVRTKWFAGLPRVDVDWEYGGVIGISRSGDVLMFGYKVQGFGMGKSGVVVIKPRW